MSGIDWGKLEDEIWGETAAAVRAELAELAKRKAGIDTGVTAKAALALARRIDSPDTTSSAVASCVRRLELTMDKLRLEAPEQQKKQETEFERRSRERAERRAAS